MKGKVAWVRILTFPLTIFVNLGKLLNLFVGFQSSLAIYIFLLSIASSYSLPHFAIVVFLFIS